MCEAGSRPRARVRTTAASLIRLVAATAGAISLCPASLLSAQGGTRFEGRLSPVPIMIQQTNTITGSGRATATLSGSTLSVTGTFKGLSAPATLARVHRGSKTGVRGPVLFELQVSTSISGTFRGTFELTAPQIDDLEHGRLYVQLHSELAPDGNLWGWLLPRETRR